jgi:hypothetical protein
MYAVVFELEISESTKLLQVIDVVVLWDWHNVSSMEVEVMVTVVASVEESNDVTVGEYVES